jgi:hypothetical protein
MHSVLDDLVVGARHESDADGCVVGWAEDDLPLAFGEDEPDARTRTRQGSGELERGRPGLFPSLLGHPPARSVRLASRSRCWTAPLLTSPAVSADACRAVDLVRPHLVSTRG